MEDSFLIELKDISFSYPNSGRVLSSLDFSLKKGERLAIIGGNGAGKTTLFHIMLGLLRPQTGTIRIFGKTVLKEADFFEPRLKIGLLFQDPDDQLFSPSVLEDVAFGPLNQGLSHKEARDIARKTLSELGILHLERRVPYELSGGEKRLVALATVLSMRPRVLLLDEPTVGLEKRALERLLRILKNYPLEALLVITHLPHLLSEILNGCLFLEDGRLHPVSLSKVQDVPFALPY